jgi:hypothetical protein
MQAGEENMMKLQFGYRNVQNPRLRKRLEREAPKALAGLEMILNSDAFQGYKKTTSGKIIVTEARAVDVNGKPLDAIELRASISNRHKNDVKTPELERGKIFIRISNKHLSQIKSKKDLLYKRLLRFFLKPIIKLHESNFGPVSWRRR